MKKFDILRYLRRFFALVLAVTMAGTVVVYWYCKNNQTYTASVNIIIFTKVHGHKYSSFYLFDELFCPFHIIFSHSPVHRKQH